ncbi:HNH endonuclease signature motif containing protein [Achromobacter xylosoxidans]|uniref:HNH endonuclease signature motif containing protein n=1 Tax=Alcaligenes xylosoxydans xylosoxydans TaxID=85698 RepID=UPI001EEB43B9|nr:HNH endonuclease signature motif containing protein [Achromobacter xylosoxidans]
MLTQRRLQEILAYDPATGIFTRLSRGASILRNPKPAGRITNRGYCQIMVDNHRYLAHRLAWLYVNGILPTMEIDHRDGVRTNNAIANLRLATRAENQQNVAVRRSNTSGHPGVRWVKRLRKWRAVIAHEGRKFHLGVFEAKDAAAAAYRDAKVRLHTFQPSIRSTQCPK